MGQKILSSLLLCILICSNIPTPSFANWYVDDARYNLSQIKWWNNYIQQIDAFITSIAEDREKLEKLDHKLSQINSNSEPLQTIIAYLQESIWDALDALADTALNIFVENIQSASLRSQDVSKVENVIISVQNNLIEGMNDVMYSLIPEKSYEETGDIHASFYMDIPQFSTTEYDFSLNNYTARSSGFDSQIIWDLSVGINIQTIFAKVSTHISGMIDIITKDSNTYISLDELSIGENAEYLFGEMLSILEKINNSDSYVLYHDARNNITNDDLIPAFDIEKLIETYTLLFEKSFFTPYAKNGNTFQLTLSRDACDSFKSLNTFLSLLPGETTCSDEEYTQMLKEFHSEINMNITLGSSNIFDFSLGTDDPLSGKIVFKSDRIKEIHLDSAFLQSDIIISSVKISGVTNIFTEWEKFATIEHSGKHGNHYFELHNAFQLLPTEWKDLEYTYNMASVETATGILDIDIQTSGSQTTFHFISNAFVNDIKFFEILINSETTQKQKYFKIDTPKESISIDNLLAE